MTRGFSERMIEDNIAAAQLKATEKAMKRAAEEREQFEGQMAELLNGSVKQVMQDVNHQAHMDFHKSVIDNYEAYKLIEVLTEILDEVRSINKKLSKRKKK